MRAFTFSEVEDARARIAYTAYVARMEELGMHPPKGVTGPATYDKLLPEQRECWRVAVREAMKHSL